MFRKLCKYSVTSFERFRKNFFRSLTFVSQVSRGFANTSFARFRNSESQFRKPEPENSRIDFSIQVGKFFKVFAMCSLLMTLAVMDSRDNHYVTAFRLSRSDSSFLLSDTKAARAHSDPHLGRP